MSFFKPWSIKLKNKNFVTVVSAAIAFVGLTSAAQADSTAGPYIGAGVGLYQTDVTIKGGDVSVTAGDTGHDSGLDVFAGYKWNLGAGGVAVEVGYTDSYGKTTDLTVGTVAANAKITASTEIAVLPSFNLSKDTAAYVRLGYASAKGEASSSGGVISNTTFTSGSSTKTFTGMVYGLGVDHSLSKNIALRAEYKVVDLSEEKVNNIRYQPRAVGLNVGLRYAF